jgi:hypothetical protein
MMGSFRRHKWEERGQPKALYYDESCKDAPVLPQFPVPICDCGKPAGVRQSRHEDTVARAYYCCNDYRVRLSFYQDMMWVFCNGMLKRSYVFVGNCSLMRHAFFPNGSMAPTRLT